jgi:hypothetical protein
MEWVVWLFESGQRYGEGRGNRRQDKAACGCGCADSGRLVGSLHEGFRVDLVYEKAQ